MVSKTGRPMNGVLKDKEVLARQIGQKALSFEAFFKCTCRGAGREKHIVILGIDGNTCG